MATASIIYKSQLECAQRVDAEYYKPAFLALALKLSKSHSRLLRQLQGTLDGSAFYPSVAHLYTKTGIPFLRIDDIRDGFVNITGDSVFLPQDILNENPNTISRCVSGDILIAKGGNTIGKVGMITQDYPLYAICRDLIVIRTASLLINRYFLLAYLLSPYGQSMMIRTASQTGQPHLTITTIRNLPVPVFCEELQSYFEDALKKMDSLIHFSDQGYKQAEQLLRSELGLQEWRAQHTVAYVRNYSQTTCAQRIDAEYFQPKYQAMVDKVSSTARLDSLGKLTTHTKGVEVGGPAYTESGIPFWRVSNLTKYGLSDSSLNFISDELYRSLRLACEPQQGELLLSKDATPGIAYFLENPIQGIISGGILRLALIRDIPPHYLELVLNSLFVQLQVEQDAGGSIIRHWKPSKVRETLIPRLSPTKEGGIAELVQRSHAARREAMLILEKAKRAVEIAVEEGEDKAMKFIG